MNGLLLANKWKLKLKRLRIVIMLSCTAAGKFVSRCAKIQQAFDVKCNLHIICKIPIRFIGARNSVYLTS